MGRALEIIAGRVTHAGVAAEAALTVNTGNSFTVRDYGGERGAHLLTPFTSAATPGRLRIRSPRLHDAAQSIRLQASVLARPLLSPQVRQELSANDPLTVEMSGLAAETDAAAYLVYYDDLPGTQAELYSPEDILPRVRNITGVLQAVVGVVGGDWSGAQAINADQDSLKADTRYAVLGYTLDASCLAIRLTGSDLGNLGIGGPGGLLSEISSEWFIRLSRLSGLPCIPVFGSNNRGNVIFDVAAVAAGAINCTLILGELE